MEVNKTHLTFSDFLQEKHAGLLEDAAYYGQYFISYDDFYKYVERNSPNKKTFEDLQRVMEAINKDYYEWFQDQVLKEHRAKAEVEKCRVFSVCYIATFSFITFYFISVIPYFIHHDFTVFGVLMRVICTAANIFNLSVQIKGFKKNKIKLREAKEKLPIECKEFKTLWEKYEVLDI